MGNRQAIMHVLEALRVEGFDWAAAGPLARGIRETDVIPNEPRPSISRRQGLAAIAAAVAGGAVLTACGGSKPSAGSGSGSAAANDQASAGAAAARNTSTASIVITPGDKSGNGSINSSGQVKVTSGTLVSVSMTDAAGNTVAGAISPDGTSWKPLAQLNRSTEYRIAATAKDPQNRKAVANATFTTVSPANSFIGYFTPDDGSTVGVGMPVSFNFDKPITNKKAVQQAITVNSSSGQQIVGHWFSDTRLDFRPDAFWAANSTVTVKLALDGVQGATGVYGIQAKTVSFKVGRSQVSTADDNTKMMTVVRDGKTIQTIPISLGAPGTTTYNGIMVISERYQQIRMNSQTVGLGKAYDIPDVPHAQRLTPSGTFVHGNYWRPVSTFGSQDTSHGCVGMHDAKGGQDTTTPGYWFYSNSLIGDVVIVKNSPDKTVQPDNGLNGWNLTWSQWQAGSAV
jgi:lipoprotein-anchoring transpeptidase ErfK/SrfK